MLRLPDSWVWDSWYAAEPAGDGGVRHHAFYLRASRGLRDPERRHRHPFVGHAVSGDLQTWEVLPDALAISEPPAFDDWTTWTGSVARDDDGRWWMAYTGSSHADEGLVQRIGFAVSADLLVWDKADPSSVIEADPRWYEKRGDPEWPDEAWRDPFLLRDEDGWHLLVTARANEGPVLGRGVVGHVTSPDLREWTVQPPITLPDNGFGQLEVVQVEIVDGVPTMVFCCMAAQLDEVGLARHGTGGVFSVTGDSLLGPYDIASARRFPHDSLYAARLVRLESGWQLIGFDLGTEEAFAGELVDPIPVTCRPGVGLVRADVSHPTRS